MYARQRDVRWVWYNMVAFLLRSKGHTFDGEIVAFGTTASKGDFGWTGAKNICYLFTSAINSLHSVTTQRINTTGVTIFGCEVGEHGVEHASIESGRRHAPLLHNRI